jgi:glycosyltransferase involved in cell wall biosynthesis
MTIPRAISQIIGTGKARFEEVKLPGSRPLKLLYLGRLSPQKGLAALLACTLPENMDLILAGPESNDSGINQLLATRLKDPTNRTYYVGPIYGLDKWKMLCTADFLIVPSLHEPFGLVALEGLATRTLVISSFVEGLSEVLTDEAAVRCGTSVDTIQAALQRVSQMTPDEYKRRTDVGFAHAATFRWDKAALQILHLYQYLHTYNLTSSQTLSPSAMLSNNVFM